VTSMDRSVPASDVAREHLAVFSFDTCWSSPTAPRRGSYQIAQDGFRAVVRGCTTPSSVASSPSGGARIAVHCGFLATWNSTSPSTQKDPGM
jgi:hypothetical protein